MDNDDTGMRAPTVRETAIHLALEKIIADTMHDVRTKILLELTANDAESRAYRDRLEAVIYGVFSETIVRQSGAAPQLHIGFIGESFQNLLRGGFLTIEKRDEPAPARPLRRPH